jgi:aspartokinase
MISTSPIKISCLVDRADVERGVRGLHEAFSLSAAAAEPPTEG